MLCIDIAGAFNNVSHKRLLDNLQKKGIPDFILHWVISFLEERTIRIKIIKGESELFLTDTGIL
jgi:Reverse transcriptase (RNA-dependent DNA polymerase)